MEQSGWNRLCKQGNIKDFYKFQTTIGKGTFADVKKAIKLDGNGEEYAIKIVDKKNYKEEEDILALMQEIQILDQLEHPNIVNLMELYEGDDKFYMVFEYMSGGQLYSRFLKQKFTEYEIIEILRPIVDALRYCHLQGIAHRDLKPENQLYENDEPTAMQKISDFGFARYSGNNLMSTQCGSPIFIAPEIISNQEYTVAVDCWSIGVIIYLLLSGEAPFSGKDHDTLFKLIKKGKYKFPEDSWDGISLEAKDLIKKLLVVDATKRLTAKQIQEHDWFTKYD